VPFTFAHPAVILPLRQRWPAALLPLILGSMAPDLPFFLPLGIKHAIPDTHSLLGALTTGTLLGLAMLATLALFAPVLVCPLWGRHRMFFHEELSRARTRAGYWVCALGWVGVGALSHYLLDSATHRDGSIVRIAPVLLLPITRLFDRDVPAYQALQYLSSLAGVVAVIVWYRSHLREMPGADDTADRPLRAGWLAGIAVCALVLALRATLRTLPYHPAADGLIYATTTHFVADGVVLYGVWSCLCSSILGSSAADRDR
jgi:Domain of unknown function (DUF4184)